MIIRDSDIKRHIEQELGIANIILGDRQIDSSLSATIYVFPVKTQCLVRPKNMPAVLLEVNDEVHYSDQTGNITCYDINGKHGICLISK